MDFGHDAVKHVIDGVFGVCRICYSREEQGGCFFVHETVALQVEMAVLARLTWQRQLFFLQLLPRGEGAVRANDHMGEQLALLVDGNAQRPQLPVFLYCPAKLDAVKYTELDLVLGKLLAE